MALRLIQIVLPNTHQERVEDLLENPTMSGHLAVWHELLADDHALTTILVAPESTEAIMDLFEQRFAAVEGFRLILLPVEAALPRPQPPEEQEEEAPQQPQPHNQQQQQGRVSREELYQDVAESIRPLRLYLSMVALSAIVAAVGLRQNDAAVIIGAMVIAPLLGPNVALSLATTLADFGLVRRALWFSLVGMLTAFAIAVGVGLLFGLDPTGPEVARRTTVDLGNVVLALAAGGAGALSFTMGMSAVLVGVMVAVALLPPLVTSGMLLGAGYSAPALLALLLMLTNVISINLAGVLTFLLQGIRPRSWYEADRARKATRNALLLWLVLLLALVALILLARQY